MPTRSLVDDATHSRTVYVSLPRAAEILDTSPRTVRRLVARGQLPAYKLNRSVRIKLSDLDALLRPIPAASEAANA